MATIEQVDGPTQESPSTPMRRVLDRLRETTPNNPRTRLSLSPIGEQQESSSDEVLTRVPGFPPVNAPTGPLQPTEDMLHISRSALASMLASFKDEIREELRTEMEMEYDPTPLPEVRSKPPPEDPPKDRVAAKFQTPSGPRPRDLAYAQLAEQATLPERPPSPAHRQGVPPNPPTPCPKTQLQNNAPTFGLQRHFAGICGWPA